MGTAVAKRKLKEALDDAVATIEPLCQELDLEFVDQPDDRQDSEWGERIEGAVKPSSRHWMPSKPPGHPYRD